MHCEIVYNLNSNDPTKKFIFLYNSANTFGKSVWPGKLIDLVKALVKYYTRLPVVNCCQGFATKETFFFICIDVKAKPCNNTGHNILGYTNLFPNMLY